MKFTKRKTRTTAQQRAIDRKLRADRGDTPGTPTGLHPRNLARSAAKAQMQLAKWKKINRNFAYNWKNVIQKYVNQGGKA